MAQRSPILLGIGLAALFLIVLVAVTFRGVVDETPELQARAAYDLPGVYGLHDGRKNLDHVVKAHSGSLYVEKMYKRDDMGANGIIAETALNMGIEISVDGAGCPSAVWVHQSAFPAEDTAAARDKLFNLYTKCPGQVVNSYPGYTNIFGQAMYFYNFLDRCVGKHSEFICDFSPRSYFFPDMFDKWREDFGDDESTYWIVKDPTKSARGFAGKDTVILSNSDVPLYRTFALPVQEYIMTPFVYKNHKFDLRVWAVMTSMNPIRVYVYRDGFPSIAPAPYSIEKATLDDLCVHIPGNSKKSCLTAGDLDPSSLPCQSEDSSFQEHITIPNGHPIPDNWYSNIWPAVQHSVTKTILAAYEEGMSYYNKVNEKGYLVNGYLLFAPTVVVDAYSGKAYVQEVGLNPYTGPRDCDLRGGSDAAKHHLSQLFKLTGILRYSRNVYMDAFEVVWQSFCQSEPQYCSESARSMCLEMVDEYFAAQDTVFDRTYPPVGFDLPHDYAVLLSTYLKSEGSRDAVQNSFLTFAAKKGLMT